jgi:branched-chain amino acid transport system ATP-binding protein
VTPAQLVLKVQAVSKAFGGIRALDGIELELREGEILGVIGPNGAGKTALINTITGFYRADAGRVEFLGEQITAEPLHSISSRGIARTFQNIRLFRRMTVLENVLVADSVFSEKPFASLFQWRQQRASVGTAMELLALMGLAEKADHRADSLPYGEARRVEIARALMRNPVLLLLDEPAAGMNEAETARLVRDIRAAMPRVRAMILIEHDMSLIRALSTRIIAMDYGRKIAEGSPDEVLSHTDVQRAYLGEAA